KIEAQEVSRDQVQQMMELKNAELKPHLEKIWGKVQASSSEEKQSTINRLRLVLQPRGVAGRDGKGNAAEGKVIFQKTCAMCHKLFGEGNTIGPDLTSVDRRDVEFLLFNIVNPSAYIRSEYINYEVETKDDQSLSG